MNRCDTKMISDKDAKEIAQYILQPIINRGAGPVHLPISHGGRDERHPAIMAVASDIKHSRGVVRYGVPWRRSTTRSWWFSTWSTILSGEWLEPAFLSVEEEYKHCSRKRAEPDEGCPREAVVECR